LAVSRVWPEQNQRADARGAAKAERAFLKQRVKQQKLAKRREAREPKPEARAGQGAEQRAEGR
jgi:hypothetical protein